MKGRRPLGRRSESVGRAVAKSRAARPRAIERRLGRRLAYLRRHDPAGHAALVGMLRRVVERQPISSV